MESTKTWSLGNFYCIHGGLNFQVPSQACEIVCILLKLYLVCALNISSLGSWTKHLVQTCNLRFFDLIIVFPLFPFHPVWLHFCVCDTLMQKSLSVCIVVPSEVPLPGPQAAWGGWQMVDDYRPRSLAGSNEQVTLACSSKWWWGHDVHTWVLS